MRASGSAQHPDTRGVEIVACAAIGDEPERLCNILHVAREDGSVCRAAILDRKEGYAGSSEVCAPVSQAFTIATQPGTSWHSDQNGVRPFAGWSIEIGKQRTRVSP